MKKNFLAGFVFLVPSVAFYLLALWFWLEWREAIPYAFNLYESYFANLPFHYCEFLYRAFSGYFDKGTTIITRITGVWIVFSAIYCFIYLMKNGKIKTPKLSLDSAKAFEALFGFIISLLFFLMFLFVMLVIGWIIFLLIVSNTINFEV